MSSRLHKIGTIFSRVEGLLNKGVLKEKDKPLWFDVYARFPPTFEPSFSREASKKKIEKIFYPEDIARAELHKKFSNQLGVINLENKQETNSQKWCKIYLNYVAEGKSEKEALDQVVQKMELETKEN